MSSIYRGLIKLGLFVSVVARIWLKLVDPRGTKDPWWWSLRTRTMLIALDFSSGQGYVKWMLTDMTHTILTIVHKIQRFSFQPKKKESMPISNCKTHLLCLKKEKEREKKWQWERNKGEATWSYYLTLNIFQSLENSKNIVNLNCHFTLTFFPRYLTLSIFNLLPWATRNLIKYIVIF